MVLQFFSINQNIGYKKTNSWRFRTGGIPVTKQLTKQVHAASGIL